MKAMLITSEDIDPHVARAVARGLAASFTKRNPSTDERRLQQAERRRSRADFYPLYRWMLGGAIAGSAGAAAVFGLGLDAGAAIGASIGLWNGIFWGSFVVGLVRSIRVSRKRVNNIHPDLLFQWLPFLELSWAERAYCETLALLAKPKSRIGESAGRRILADLNALMERTRHLDVQRAELQRIAGSDSLNALEQEQARISERVESARDPVARADLEESLTLCRVRLESARRVLPAIERLDAQQEKVVQTLASLQSRIARLDSDPSPMMSPEASELKNTLNALAAQTRAVEDAVQEVTAVRA